MATEECRSRKAARYSLEENPAHDHTSIGKNCNQSSSQSPTVRPINADHDAKVSCLCPCAGSIMVPPAPNKPVVKSGVKVVTYKKRLGPDKLLVVKQEIEVPRVTPWIIFHGLLFILLMILLFLLLLKISVSITKSEEILSVLMLLLLMLAYFRPRYFVPYMIFDMNADEPEPKPDEDEDENDSQIECYLCCE